MFVLVMRTMGMFMPILRCELWFHPDGALDIHLEPRFRDHWPGVISTGRSLAELRLEVVRLWRVLVRVYGYLG
jgi:hypothetical protein